MRVCKNLMVLGFVLSALVGCGGGASSGEPSHAGSGTSISDGSGSGGGGTLEDAPAKTAPPLAQDSPGVIPGFGKQPGPALGVPFALPAGIKAPSTLKGVFGMGPANVTPNQNLTDPANLVGSLIVRPQADFSIIDNFNEPFYTAEKGLDAVIGSGVSSVNIRIPLENETSEPVEVTFPAGLVINSNKSSAQNGLILKDVKVIVPPKSVFTISLLAYCVNKDLEQSFSFSEYSFGVVSKSSTVRELIDLLKNKKINYEEYSPNYKNYWQVATDLQLMVYNLTDFRIPLGSVHYDYIRTIPDSVALAR